MNQAYQHLALTNTHYNFINDQITNLVKRWNATHTKQTDPKVIGEACKTIFKYHHWINVEDIEPAIELGIMGDFGENKGLNNETIYNWFKSYSQRKRKGFMDSHEEYKSKPTYIPIEQKRETRSSLIQTFMNFHDEYKQTHVYNSKMDHYIPAFFRWFKKLGLITLTDQQEDEMFTDEALRLRDMMSFLSQGKKYKKRNTAKSLFISAFDFVCTSEKDLDVENQLKRLSI